jgi:tetratricopeptide (TPR) repeat protein
VCYRKALAADPHCVLANEKLGAMLARRGDGVNAEIHFRRCLELGHQPVWLLLDLGNLLFNRGAINDAAECFRRVLILESANPHGHNNYAATRQLAGDFEAAIAHYQPTLELDPGHAVARSQLEYCLELGRPSGRQEADVALKGDPVRS